MNSRLLVTGIVGVTASIVCLTAAIAVSGKNPGDWASNFAGWDQPGCGVVLSGSDGSRSVDWNGSDEVQLEIPADVHYRRGQGDKLVIQGDQAVLPLIQVQGKGRIHFTCRMRHPGDLVVTLPGRDFKSYSVKGSGDVTLEGIDQPDVEISVAGSSDVTASGKADKLEYNLAGSGDSKFGGLETRRAEVNIAGSGDTEINASDSLEVNIAGSGDVKLTTEPRHIETNIFGSGSIVHANGDVSRTHGAGSTSHGEIPPVQPPVPPKGI